MTFPLKHLLIGDFRAHHVWLPEGNKLFINIPFFTIIGQYWPLTIPNPGNIPWLTVKRDEISHGQPLVTHSISQPLISHGYLPLGRSWHRRLKGSSSRTASTILARTASRNCASHAPASRSGGMTGGVTREGLLKATKAPMKSMAIWRWRYVCVKNI